MSCPTRTVAGHDCFDFPLRDHFFFTVSTTWVDLRCVATLAVWKRPLDALRPILNCFDFSFRSFIGVDGRGARSPHPPFSLSGRLLRDQNRPRPEAIHFGVEALARQRAGPPRAEHQPEARRNVNAVSHGRQSFGGAYLAKPSDRTYYPLLRRSWFGRRVGSASSSPSCTDTEVWRLGLQPEPSFVRASRCRATSASVAGLRPKKLQNGRSGPVPYQWER